MTFEKGERGAPGGMSGRMSASGKPAWMRGAATLPKTSVLSERTECMAFQQREEGEILWGEALLRGDAFLLRAPIPQDRFGVARQPKGVSVREQATQYMVYSYDLQHRYYQI